MALQSKLFLGDTKLEAAAVSDPAHIKIGAKGEHVRKIQFALTVLDGVNIAQDGAYGAETAAAVLAYKRKRNIINRSYQTQADDIVGKMTMVTLDTEMLRHEIVPHAPVRIIPRSYWVTRPPKSPASLPGELIMQPFSTGSFDVIDGSPGSVVIEDPAIAKIKPARGLPGDRFAVTENRQPFQVSSGHRLGMTTITATVAHPPGAAAGAHGSSASLTLVVGRPIVFLGIDWTTTERTKILAALQQLTSDALVLSGGGDQIFVDPSRSVAPNRNTGQTLLRGLQHPTRKVFIVPATGSFIPDTRPSGNDVLVELAFASGDLATFHFFTITGANVPGPGGNAVEKAPGFIVLAHELVHAFRMLRHVFVAGSRDNEFFDPSGKKFVERVFREELTVDGIDGSERITENSIRLEQGIGIKIAHASPSFRLDKQGVRPVPESAAPPWWPDFPVP
ncbi:MAG: hypothetical protein JO170_03785 [Verrucomicrobia bacterium]|nr:hypothetical protein [Verrucomicrobiota bacterium]